MESKSNKTLYKVNDSEKSEFFIFVSYITGSQNYEREMMVMNDKKLREGLHRL